MAQPAKRDGRGDAPHAPSHPGEGDGKPSDYEGNTADEQLMRERIEYPADQTDEG